MLVTERFRNRKREPNQTKKTDQRTKPVVDVIELQMMTIQTSFVQMICKQAINRIQIIYKLH